MYAGWIGSLISALFSSGSSAMYSSREASKNRKFQANMSATAHQRQMLDLGKAGLNPILGYSKGSGGSSTPAGAQGNMNPMPDIPSSAIGLKLAKAQWRKMSAEAQKTEIESNILKKEVPKSDIIYDIFENFVKPLYQSTTKDSKSYPKKIGDKISNSVKAKKNRIRDDILYPWVPHATKPGKRKPYGKRTNAKNPFGDVVN